jgi:hypothetical protein
MPFPFKFVKSIVCIAATLRLCVWLFRWDLTNSKRKERKGGLEPLNEANRRELFNDLRPGFSNAEFRIAKPGS